MVRKDYPLNGKVYSIILPTPSEGMPLCLRASVLIASKVLKLFAEIKQLEDDPGSKDDRIQLVIAKLSEALQTVDPIAVHQLMMDAAYKAHLSVDGTNSISNQVTFDQHFSSCRQDAYPVLLWCLWQCVSDFFPQLGTFSQMAKKAAEEAFRSPMAGQ